ncbi:MAG: DNA mismatch repair endonuclease MutL, partial [Pseudobdellovibrionaceae bacterium]
MSSIELLSPEVVNQIAAGEVVERPAHLVKELIENSIDAFAKKIVIQIDDGGRRLRIEDDGMGILKTDLNKALERFATSKIRNSDDLWRLKSYGFRGEALASISSVSLLTLKSYHKESKQSFQITSEFGEVS